MQFTVFYSRGPAVSVWLDPDSNLSIFRCVSEIVIRECSPYCVDSPVITLKLIAARLANQQMFFVDSVVIRTDTIEGIGL
jgi:hypothetical protein